MVKHARSGILGDRYSKLMLGLNEVPLFMTEFLSKMWFNQIQVVINEPKPIFSASERADCNQQCQKQKRSNTFGETAVTSVSGEMRISSVTMGSAAVSSETTMKMKFGEFVQESCDGIMFLYLAKMDSLYHSYQPQCFPDQTTYKNYKKWLHWHLNHGFHCDQNMTEWKRNIILVKLK